MIKITCDFREKRSGIPEMLIQKNAEVGFSNLIAGDYIINNQIIVERKSAEDCISFLFVVATLEVSIF